MFLFISTVCTAAISLTVGLQPRKVSLAMHMKTDMAHTPRLSGISNN
jgi:hypothetical protein